MSVPFTVGVYLLVGLLVMAWLHGQGRLPSGGAVRLASALFWPAYLPVCLGPSPRARDASTTATEPLLAQLAERIRALPVDKERQQQYLGAVERITTSLRAREAELSRLHEAELRLIEVAKGAGADASIVDEELAKVRAAVSTAKDDLAKARAQVVRLAVRVEVFAAKTPREPLESQLSAFQEELDHLLSAQDEAERISA